METTILTSHHSNYRRDIDGLRGIAILAVLGFHAFPQWFKSGFIGVDIFFVISGFLISSIILEDLSQNKFSFINFYIRRINRIFPALIITLVGVFCLGWYILISDQYKELCKHIVAGAAFLSNIILWNEVGYFDSAAELKPLLHLWSLGVEEQFYIIWPLLLALSWKVRNIKGVCILAVVIITTSFTFNSVLNQTVEGFYSPLSRFWELMLGSFLSAAIFRYRNCNCNQYKNVISAIGLLLLVSGFVYIDKLKGYLYFWMLLPTTGAALLIFADQTAWINKHILSHKLLVWIGLISYPLYLYHWPLLSLANIFSGGISTHITITIISISFFLAFLTYTFIEKPIRFARNRSLKAVILLILMVLIGGVGYYSHTTNWTEIRLPVEFRIQDKYKSPKQEWIKSVRGNVCYIQDISSTMRASLCYEAKKPSVLLWGDSHAAALYPGLQKLQTQGGFGIIHATQSGCPALFNLEKLTFRKNCNEINENIFKLAIRSNPNIIILHAAWKLNHYELTNDELVNTLTLTLNRLKSHLPNTRIIVIGPVPRWVTSPKQVAFLNWYKTRIIPIPSMQQATRLDDIDALLEKVSNKAGVEFISIIKILCDDRGCLAKTDNEDGEFIAFDYGHFTKSGSEFIIDKIKSRLFDSR